MNAMNISHIRKLEKLYVETHNVIYVFAYYFMGGI